MKSAALALYHEAPPCWTQIFPISSSATPCLLSVLGASAFKFIRMGFPKCDNFGCYIRRWPCFLTSIRIIIFYEVLELTKEALLEKNVRLRTLYKDSPLYHIYTKPLTVKLYTITPWYIEISIDSLEVVYNTLVYKTIQI